MNYHSLLMILLLSPKQPFVKCIIKEISIIRIHSLLKRMADKFFYIIHSRDKYTEDLTKMIMY
jgi:hypothetical protein